MNTLLCDTCLNTEQGDRRWRCGAIEYQSKQHAAQSRIRRCEYRNASMMVGGASGNTLLTPVMTDGGASAARYNNTPCMTVCRPRDTRHTSQHQVRQTHGPCSEGRYPYQVGGRTPASIQHGNGRYGVGWKGFHDRVAIRPRVVYKDGADIVTKMLGSVEAGFHGRVAIHPRVVYKDGADIVTKMLGSIEAGVADQPSPGGDVSINRRQAPERVPRCGSTPCCRRMGRLGRAGPRPASCLPCGDRRWTSAVRQRSRSRPSP